MPLELLTNEKLRQQITNEKNELFLAFTFTPTSQTSLTLSKKQSTKEAKPYDLWDLYFLSGKFQPEMFTLPVFEERKSALEKYINSHDNLIKALYEKETTILPIRMDTLDFYKMVEPGTDHLTHLCKDSIEQAQYVTAEKLTDDAEKTKVFYITAEKGYKHKNRMDIRFLSFFETSRTLSEKWRVFYRFSEGKDYEELLGEYLTIPQDKHELFVQVFFTQEHEISILYHKLDFKNLKGDVFSFTYMFPYNTLNYELTVKPLHSGLDEMKVSDRSIEITSYFNKDYPKNPFNQAQNCSVCFKSLEDWEKTLTGKCFYSHLKCQQTVIMMKCRNCPTIYCLKHKFRPELRDNAIYSPFDSKFEKLLDRHGYFEKTKNIQFKQCDYCGRIESSAEYYLDSDRGIVLCQCCAFTLSTKK